jgi:putative DNA primase/helicase
MGEKVMNEKRDIKVTKRAPDISSHDVESVAAELQEAERKKAEQLEWRRSEEAKRFSIAVDTGRTDNANAWRFVTQYEGRVLHVAQWKRWLAWDGRRWRDDSGVGVYQLAKRFSDKLWAEFTEAAKAGVERDELGVIRTFVKQTNQRAKMADFIALAASDERVVCQSDALNRDPLLLNVENGTVDLRTGELGQHSPNDLITQLAPVKFDADADCPRWLEALNLIFDGDQSIIDYLQRLVGYFLTGLTSQHVLPIAYGVGCNGKSTITNVLTGLLGDYATIASEDLLLPTKQHQHPTEKAQLYQKRFVAISEPSQGRYMDDAKVKGLTGGDQVNCRRCNEDFWTFTPTHKFWMSTNHKPKIRGTDEGIWRRVKLIPFTVDLRTKTDPQAGLSDWLIANEGPGILAWAVRGFRDWAEFGFSEPAAVTAATAEYRSAEDELGQWLAEFCVIEDRAVELTSRLFESYQRAGGKLSKTAFGEQLGQRFRKEKATSGPYRQRVVCHGLRLVETEVSG